jgi:hypothetical protein
MQERSIDWLKQQQINKRFTVCKDSDRVHVSDPTFEDWIVTEAQKRVATEIGDGFKADDSGFTYCSMPFPRPDDPADPFFFIKPVYSLYRCDWKHVTGVFQGENGRVYIFTSKEKR